MNPIADDILMHYGVKRRSGRYPWGSGDNPPISMAVIFSLALKNSKRWEKARKKLLMN